MDTKLVKRGVKLRDDLKKLRADATKAGEHDVADAVRRAERELNHPSFTDVERKAGV